MATTIITNPAASLTISDPTPSDTITVTDGPAENGFQTTEVTTAANTFIFANQTAVTIDGGNNGDQVVLDNPDPAAGLQSLTIQNLGTGSTINGSNPNANSPDTAVANLNLQAYTSIGNLRALRTQVNTLSASAGLGGAGNINIANGVATPETLNIGVLSATNAAGGTITLSNNGTINDTSTGIVATGAINITTNGGTADLNTGSGAGIVSNTGSVNLTVGRDINWGDGVGTGNIGAATGITASAGGNITLNANTIVTNGNSGNISLTAGGNFTMLASPGNQANAPEIVSNTAGGTISLTAGSGHTLTLDSTGATAVQANNGGTIILAADAMVINKAVIDGNGVVPIGRVDLTPASAGEAISLGGANAPGVLGLTQAELNQITAGVVQIGSPTAGNTTISSPITGLGGSLGELSLISNGSISESPLGSLAVPGLFLRVSSTGPVTLNNPNNNIQNLAANTANALTVNDGTNSLTVGSFDGVTGITTSNSAINLTADNMNLSSPVNAGTGIVTLAPFTASQFISLGGANAVGTLGLSDAALGQITASVLRVGTAGSGNIGVKSVITRHAGYNTLSLATGGAMFQNFALSVANLALSTVSGIDLTNSSNSVDTLAFANTTNGIVLFDNSSANALTIGAVDGITQSSNTSGATTTISTGGNLTVAAGLLSAGTTSLTSSGGAIFGGANAVPIDITAPTLVLSASTGIGTAAAPLQTQVTTLNATTGTGGVFINNGKAAPVTLNIGNGGGGVQVTGASGDIVLTNNGTIKSVSAGDNIQGPGNITVKALGANADLNLSGQTSLFSVRGTGSGLVDLEAGRDISLGGGVANSFGAVQATTGSIVLQAGRNFTLNPNAYLQVFSGNGSITASAGGNFTMLTSPASLQNAPYFITAGGNIALSAGAGHTMTLASTGTDAVVSNGGNITLSADNMVINQGVNASTTGSVLIQPVTAGELIGLGTGVGTLNVSNAALSHVTAKNLTIGNAAAGSVVLGGAFRPLLEVNLNLTINTGSNFTALGGSTVIIGAGTLTIGFDENNHGATADLSGASISAGAVIVNSGAGNDIFITGAGPETINGGGGVDTAVFSGTMAQYTINAAGGVVTVTKGGVTDTLTGIRFLQFSDQTIAASPAAPNDFNGDGRSDVLLGSNGAFFDWDMNGSQISTSQTLTFQGNPVTLDASWSVAGIGDFNGDGRPTSCCAIPVGR